MRTLVYIGFRPYAGLDNSGGAASQHQTLACPGDSDHDGDFVPLPLFSTDGAERASRNPGTLDSYFWAVNIGLGPLPIQAHGIARIRSDRHGLAIWINCKAPHPNRVDDLTFHPLAHDSGDPFELHYGPIPNRQAPTYGLGAARPGRTSTMYKDGACFANPVLSLFVTLRPVLILQHIASSPASAPPPTDTVRRHQAIW